MDKYVNNFYSLDGHSIEEYERSHKARLDFLVEDLKLNEIEGKMIGDFGCGYAPIFRRMGSGKNGYFGYDGDESRLANKYCLYTKCDLSRGLVPENGLPGSFNTNSEFLDVAFCFETLEHLTNPYVCLSEIKRVLKKEGLFYLSIPHEDCTHNTIYPGLLYPVDNFIEFLKQMAFEIVEHKIHDKAFKQHVFVLRNKDWSHSQMKWYKNEDKFRAIPPHVAVNL